MSNKGFIKRLKVENMSDYNPSDELKYSLWKIIEKYKDSKQNSVNGLRFNKIMALLNHRLLEEKNLDIRLPKCWYLYGEATVPTQLPKEVEWEGLDNDEEKTSVSWMDERPAIRSSKNRKKIDSIIDSLYSLYPPDGDINKLIEEDYSKYAPYEFQKLYKVFRYDTEIVSMIDQDGSLRSKAFYAKEIKKAMEAFPYEDFPELKVEARKIELLLPSLFKEYPQKNEKGIEIAKDFWKIFCRFLRFKENSYVVRDKVEYWKEVALKDLKEYKLKLSEDIKDLKELELSVNKDPMIEKFLTPKSLGDEFDNLSNNIDDVVYG